MLEITLSSQKNQSGYWLHAANWSGQKEGAKVALFFLSCPEPDHKTDLASDRLPALDPVAIYAQPSHEDDPHFS